MASNDSTNADTDTVDSPTNTTTTIPPATDNVDYQGLIEEYNRTEAKSWNISGQSIRILELISAEIDGFRELQEAGAAKNTRSLKAKKHNDLWRILSVKIHKKCDMLFSIEALKKSVFEIENWILAARALSELKPYHRKLIKKYDNTRPKTCKVPSCSTNVLEMIATEFPELNENIEKHSNLLKLLAMRILVKHETLYTTQALTTAMEKIRERIAADGDPSELESSHLDPDHRIMVEEYYKLTPKKYYLPIAHNRYSMSILKVIATEIKEFPLLWKKNKDLKQEELEKVEVLWKGLAVKVSGKTGVCYLTQALKDGMSRIRELIGNRSNYSQNKLDAWDDYPSFRYLFEAWKPNTVNARIQKRKTACHSNGGEEPAGISSKRSKNSVEDSGSSFSESLGNYPDDIDEYPPVNPIRSNGGALPMAAQDEAPIKEELDADHMEGTSSSTTASHQVTKSPSPMFDRDEMKILDIIGYFPDIWKSNKMSEKAFEQARRMLSEETGRAFSARVVKSCFFEAVGHIRDCVFDAIVDLELNEEDTTDYLRKELSYYEVFSYYQETLKSYEEDLRKYYNLRIVKTEPKEDQPEEDHLLGQSNPSTTQRPAAFYLQRPRRACVRTSRTILNTTVHATDQSPTQQLPAVQGKPTVNISKIRTLTTANTENSKGFTEAVHMCILQEVKKRSNLWTLGISEEEAWQEVAMEVKEKHQQLLTTFDLRRIMLNWQFDLKTRIRNAIEETSENGGNFEEELQKWEHYSHIEFLMNTPAMKDEVTFRKKLEGLIAPENEEDAANSQ